MTEPANVSQQTSLAQALQLTRDMLIACHAQDWERLTALEAEREPLVLRTVDDLSQAETAAVLGITEKAVETRVRRARAKLSERLAQE